MKNKLYQSLFIILPLLLFISMLAFKNVHFGTALYNLHLFQTATAQSVYNDIYIKLYWDNTEADLDLYVKEPTGEVASKFNTSTAIGATFVASATGPETYTLQEGITGNYEISVKYEDPERPAHNANTELIILLDEETKNERTLYFGPVEMGVGNEEWNVYTLFYEAITKGKGGCFIATAAYGTPLAEEVQILNKLRDRYLLTNFPGRILVSLYYKSSPPLARLISQHGWLRFFARMILLPLVIISNLIVSGTIVAKTGAILVIAASLFALTRLNNRKRSCENGC